MGLISMLFAIAVIGSPPVAPTRNAEAIGEALDRRVPAALAEHKVPSLSIALIHDGQVDLVRSWGEQAAGVPATTTTLYNVASLTKPVSAETILRLVAAGKLDLDEPMSRYWVDPDVVSDPRHTKLTARLSLSHRTGFANWRRQTGGKLRFGFSPGKGFRYSGEGYEYAARYAAQRVGASLDRLAESAVLEPLGMRDTSYIGQPWFAGRIAVPNRDGDWLTPSIADKAVASDEMHTTARDYGRFLAAVIRGDGLTAELALQRRTIQIDQTRENCNRKQLATCPLRAGFGLGWQVLEFKGKTMLMHTGNDQGEFTFAYWSPDTREGAVLLTNSNNGGAVIVAALDSLGFDAEFTAYMKAIAER